MPISLKCKLKKLNHNGSLTNEEYEDLLKKLDGHDAELEKKIRADVTDRIENLRVQYVDACNMCTSVNCEQCHINQFIEDLEQLKEK